MSKPLPHQWLSGADQPNSLAQQVQENFDALATEGENQSPRVIRGRVLGGTSVSVGEGAGWSVARNSQGNYTITFATPFGGVPSVVATPHFSAGDVVLNIQAVTALAFTVFMFMAHTGTSAPTDSNVMFIAMGF